MLDIPQTLEELRDTLVSIRLGYEAGSREWFALTIAYGVLEPNE